MTKRITLQWEADQRFQPFLAQLIGQTVTWSASLEEAGTATVEDCRIDAFDPRGRATFEIYLAIEGS